ncbi:MAG: hypothetical protein ABI614_20395 [Planctomycetota bacterium]
MNAKIQQPTDTAEIVTPETRHQEHAHELFAASPRLGEVLNDLAHKQQEIDRRAVERLAKLREIQSFD